MTMCTMASGEGYSGAYQPLAGDFLRNRWTMAISMDAWTISSDWTSTGALPHTQYTEDGATEFRVWGLDVEIRNAPFALLGDSAW